MSLHDHHENCCEHKEVKYCKVCKVVYCKSRGKEWREQEYHWYPYTYTITTGDTYKVPSSPTTAGNVTWGCNHT